MIVSWRFSAGERCSAGFAVAYYSMEITMNITSTQAGRADGVFDSDANTQSASPLAAGRGAQSNFIINDGCFGGRSRCRPYPPSVPTLCYPGQQTPIGSVQEMLKTLLEMLQKMLGRHQQPGLVAPPPLPMPELQPKPWPPFPKYPPGSGPFLPPGRLPPSLPIFRPPGAITFPIERGPKPWDPISARQPTGGRLRQSPEILVGMTESDARKIAQYHGVRELAVVPWGMATTTEYNPNRLKVELDESGRVSSASWN